MEQQNIISNKQSKLSANIKKILFHSEETGYLVGLLQDNSKISGNYLSSHPDSLLEEDIILTGSWQEHKKYGAQFVFSDIEVAQSELYFFLSKVVKNVGDKLTKTLLKKYSDDELSEILDNNPSQLLDIKGIKEKKLNSIVKSWKEYTHIRELGKFLTPFGVSTPFLIKISTHFKDMPNLIDLIKKNPYILTKVKQIGFKRADEIALGLGIDTKSEFRIKACITYTINEYSNSDGNSSIAKSKLYELLDKSLHFFDEQELYDEQINQMLIEDELKNTSDTNITTSYLYNMESKIIKFFKDREFFEIDSQITDNIDSFIDSVEQKNEIEFSEEQKEVTKLINSGKSVAVLVGYAGTGKTTSSKLVLELLLKKYDYNNIVCCALSGIASQRIGDATGFNSYTIQSLLMQKKQDEETLKYDVVLLDEASMVNSQIFYSLIKLLKDDCIFVIVGDDGQLPPIGAGEVFGDIIKYELANITKLTKIYRQNEKQAIAIIANDIREGKVPDYTAKYDDFFFKDISIPNYYAQKNSTPEHQFRKSRYEIGEDIRAYIRYQASQRITKLHKLLKEKKIFEFLTSFEVITPIKNGNLGVETLNKDLQNIFNPRVKNKILSKQYEFRTGDKVIHIKNENMQVLTPNDFRNGVENFFEKRVFNGMLGLIIKIDMEANTCAVLYPADNIVVVYDNNKIEPLLSLSYALTIHKTQGAEYDEIMIPMTFSHYIMHNTKLLYTAITRAKKGCEIVGEVQAFESACQKLDVTKRETVIKDILKI